MNTPPPTRKAGFDPFRITRPDPILLKHYVIVSLLSGPLFPIVFLPLWFKYKTMEYHFDEDGVSMRWGALFRREIHLTYRRIQDIHLTRGVIQRKLGLANVELQTASGSATPEMTIEGVLAAEQLRDFLYTQMRGAQDDDESIEEATPESTGEDEALALLREIRDLLQEAAGSGEGS